MVKGKTNPKPQFKVYVNSRRKGNFKRHIVETGFDKTLCGISLNQNIPYHPISQTSNCQKCLNLLDLRFNET